MASLLPNAKQVFLDANGSPLAGGSVTFYIPGTSTLKDTYQDAAAATLNTNPVILDGAGSAIIYGSGIYRQIVRDASNNVIWDQVTSDTATSLASWAGTSTGTANAQAVTAPNFTNQAGQSIDFVAGFTNTAALALLPNESAGIPVRRNSVTGPVALTGGEVIAGNLYHAAYTGGVLLIEDFDKAYVDNSIATASASLNASLATKLSLTGGTLSGALNLAGHGIVNLGMDGTAGGAANKSYVDAQHDNAIAVSEGYAGSVASAAQVAAQNYALANFVSDERLVGEFQINDSDPRPAGSVMVNCFDNGVQVVRRYLQRKINGGWYTAEDA